MKIYKLYTYNRKYKLLMKCFLFFLSLSKFKILRLGKKKKYYNYLNQKKKNNNKNNNNNKLNNNNNITIE